MPVRALALAVACGELVVKNANANFIRDTFNDVADLLPAASAEKIEARIVGDLFERSRCRPSEAQFVGRFLGRRTTLLRAKMRVNHPEDEKQHEHDDEREW